MLALWETDSKSIPLIIDWLERSLITNSVQEDMLACQLGSAGVDDQALADILAK